MSIDLSSFYTSDAKKSLYINKRQYEYTDNKVRDLLRNDKHDDYFNKINTRPVYQRHIRWKPNAMNSFIDSVFKRRYVQPILMYQLHPEDLSASNYTNCSKKYEYEVMDGQHRLYTLSAFQSAKLQVLPHISKPFIVHWVHEVLDENGCKVQICIFYEKTDDVVNWCKVTGKTPQFLTEEGKKNFDNTIIKVATITSRLTINERREEFMSLQNGVPVRNSDYLKNMTECKFVASFEYNDAEVLMETFFSHCSKKASNFWTQWICRCYTLFSRFKKEGDPSVKPVSEYFLHNTDTAIKNLIKSNNTLLNPPETVLDEFYDVFKGFIEFLQNLKETIIFNPTQIFALFYYLCDEKRNTQIILTHMENFAKAGQEKNKKKMWENTEDNETRRKYFNECLCELNEMVQPAMSIDDTPITTELREEVWKKCINGKCAICEEEEITKDNFEAGHIVARKLCGQTNIDNFLPMCLKCNRTMGIKNALEYKKDKYPFSRLYLHLY